MVMLINGKRGYYDINHYEIVSGSIIPKIDPEKPRSSLETILGPDVPEDLNNPYIEVDDDKVTEMLHNSMVHSMKKIFKNSLSGAY